ncbi:MAG TPA: TIGR01777 family oxidoreductase [Gemmataceae bacterium]|nr:TIGR01777 family oxidoreductase [Gemmataceae bacterium]
MKVFVTGGTGLIGSRLIKRLLERQDSVVLLTRSAETARARFGDTCQIVEGDPLKRGDWMDAVPDCDAVVNLAGESLFRKRWNPKFLVRITESRLKTTEHIVHALIRKPERPAGGHKVFVNASAVGYYGALGDEEVVEDHVHGHDKLAELCVDWEKTALSAEPLGVRVVTTRTGVVLDRDGGALRQMLTPFKLFVGGPIGSGKQWMSWIHHADMTGLLLFALDNAQVSGPMNATAPNPVTNKEFARALGRALHRPSFLPTPKFALRLALGKVAKVITTGQRVIPKKALSLGYQFQFPTLDAALADLFK